MAHAITFKPKPVDFHQELMNRVEAAPKEHSEALLVLWDLLQLSHDTGILELVKGVIGGKDIIAGKLAESAALPESVAAIRNAIALARILGSLDADLLQRMAHGLDPASLEKTQKETNEKTEAKKEGKPVRKEEKAPSLWQLGKRAFSEDSRRGLGFAMHLLTTLGKATKE